jgi:hypothetical protein
MIRNRFVSFERFSGPRTDLVATYDVPVWGASTEDPTYGVLLIQPVVNRHD